MWQFLESLENSSFPTWVRETPNVLGYSTVLALHTFGMAFLVGLSGVIALRVLGALPSLPLAPLERFFPLIVVGFWVNAVTGGILVTLAARSLLTNVDFYIKLIAIVGAVVSLRSLRNSAFGDPASSDTRPGPRKGKIAAGAMLIFWGVAITAGRLTAYTVSVRWQTACAVLIFIVVMLAVRYVAVRLLGWNDSAPQVDVTPSTNVAVPTGH